MSSHETPEENGNTFVRITNREIYNALQELKSAMVKLADQGDTIEDHGSRIRALELRWYGVVAGLMGALGTIIYTLVKGH